MKDDEKLKNLNSNLSEFGQKLEKTVFQNEHCYFLGVGQCHPKVVGLYFQDPTDTKRKSLFLCGFHAPLLYSSMETFFAALRKTNLG